VVVRLTDSQRAWIIHALKSTVAPNNQQAQDLAAACVEALGGLP
jgi:hypothetical protein